MQSRFAPILHPDIRALLATAVQPFDTQLRALGSPLHVMFPQIVRENLVAFQRVFDARGIASKILYAQKANKSIAVLEELAAAGAGVDVSSAQELAAALSHGIPGMRLCVSGPVKRDRLLALALRHGSTISVDTMDELLRVECVRERIGSGLRAQVLLRLTEDGNTVSRFGFPHRDVPDALAYIRANRGIQLRGFAFHIDAYDAVPRVHALVRALQHVQNARAAGMEPDVIDIGGGFPVAYLQPEAWVSFTDPQNADDRPVFFRDKTFPGFYPYGTRVAGASFLAEVLDTVAEDHGESIGATLQRLRVALWIEPGRALLDQCGITLMRVHGVKRLEHGDSLVLVDANINHLSEQWFQSDFLPEPLLLARGSAAQEPCVAAVAGNTCLESDILTWRKVTFDAAPQPGDILVYANTAGYQMDSNESSFHRLPLPEKVAWFTDGTTWSWVRDAEYASIDLPPRPCA